jgi:hypothetical protein
MHFSAIPHDNSGYYKSLKTLTSIDETAPLDITFCIFFRFGSLFSLNLSVDSRCYTIEHLTPAQILKLSRACPCQAFR